MGTQHVNNCKGTTDDEQLGSREYRQKNTIQYLSRDEEAGMRLREIKTFKNSCVYKSIGKKAHAQVQTHAQKRPKNALTLHTGLVRGYPPPHGASQQIREEVAVFLNAQFSVKDPKAYKETWR